MSTPDGDPRRLYRQLIDRLVKACLEGQGQIGPRRARQGVWNANATPETMPDQHAMNEALARMADGDREAVARVLEEVFVSGVHLTLAVLYEAQLPPFEEGYEGSPFHDFVGRLGGWPWPE